MSGAITPRTKIGADEDQFEPLKNDLLLRAARGDRVERPPMWIMRQAGRYLPEYNQTKGDNDFFAVCRDPELASTITIQPIERYAGLLDAAIIFSDILVIPQAMGMEVEMVEGKGPSFPSPLLDSTPKDALYRKLVSENVDIPALVEKELYYVFDAIALTRKKLAGRVPLIGFVGAPWTLFAYMVEGGSSKTFMFAKSWIFKYPLESKRLLQRISEICVEFLARQVLAGAQVVQIFDSHAGELSPNDFGNFSLPYLKYIATHLPLRLHHLASHKYPERTGYTKHLYPPMIVFAKGAWYALDTLCSSGYNVVSLDWTHDPNESIKVADGRVVLQGNLDPGVLYGGKDAIIRESRRMVEGFWGNEVGSGKKSGWIVNLGHGITPHVDPEDLKTFLTEAKRYCLEITGEASR